jgi:ABC-type uncharacterized transport system YnjBCD substrate-binding protein
VKKLVILLLILNVAINCSAQTAQESVSIREKDSLTLIILYNSTGDTNWTNKKNWLSSEQISNWYGITVEHNRVTIAWFTPRAQTLHKLFSLKDWPGESDRPLKFELPDELL